MSDYTFDLRDREGDYLAGSKPLRCGCTKQARYCNLLFFVILISIIIILSVLFVNEKHSSSDCNTSPNAAETSAKDLFDDYWNAFLEWNPERGTWNGIREYNNKLANLSQPAIGFSTGFIVFDLIQVENLYERLQEIMKEKNQLSNSTYLSLQVLEWELELYLDGSLYYENALYMNHMRGPQIDLENLMYATVFTTTSDLDLYLERLSLFPWYMNQSIGSMNQGILMGIVYPCVILDPVVSQITSYLGSIPNENPFFNPFNETFMQINMGITNQTIISHYQTLGINAIINSVIPAFQNLMTFWNETYLASCRSTIGATDLPNGRLYYDFKVSEETTSNQTAWDIYQTGLSEVDRIQNEMLSILSQVNFTGDLQAFNEFLRNSSQFYFTAEEDLLTYVRNIYATTSPLLTTLFNTFPRCPMAVLPVPPTSAPSAGTAYYYTGAVDCSRPGTYYINTYNLPARPKYSLTSVSLHEGVPGHHFQGTLQQEMTTLPTFQSSKDGPNAYLEGWGLYAESLGYDMNLYSDPYIHYGALGDEMLRACRLVVDTGMHAFNWTREESVQYMLNLTPNSETSVRVEIDRYIAFPGQALGYKSGELQIQQMKKDAMNQLGDSFDIRKFHEIILQNGALPMNLLQQEVDLYLRL